MSHFIRNGNSWRIADDASLDIHSQLPAGNYVIVQDMHGNLLLQQVDTFELKGKRYGDTDRNRDRIFNTFTDRSSSTGVMLTGEKGSGKTMLAKSLAIRCAEDGIPCILINQDWRGEAFNSLLQDISQPCMILFDEFEKVYDSDEQEEMLTLLDGVFPSKKLFVLTCNDKWRVNQHMRNRQGRIFYMLDFTGLDEDFVVEYCHDNLKNLANIDGVLTVAGLFEEFNFDMLKALVEDMNRFKETPQECLEMLNAKPEFSNDSKFKISLFVDEKEVEEANMEDKEWIGNPLQKGIHVGYYAKSGKVDEDSDEEGHWDSEVFAPADLKHIDSKGSKFIMVNGSGARVVLSRVAEKGYHYDFGAF